MIATYESTCPRCRGRILQGQTIQKGQGGWTHKPCPVPSPVPASSSVPSSHPAASLLPGVYERPDGEVFVVKPNRDKTHLYAKRLILLDGGRRLSEGAGPVPIEFEYAPGAVFTLKAEFLMPLDRAKDLSLLYGRCINCGRFLKAAQSVEQGIGPVCAKAFRGYAHAGA